MFQELSLFCHRKHFYVCDLQSDSCSMTLHLYICQSNTWSFAGIFQLSFGASLLSRWSKLVIVRGGYSSALQNSVVQKDSLPLGLNSNHKDSFCPLWKFWNLVLQQEKLLRCYCKLLLSSEIPKAEAIIFEPVKQKMSEFIVIWYN